MTLQNILKEKKGTIVDVRCMEEIKKLNQPLILCCASGMRSGQAHDFLNQQGITCLNGGGWTDVNYYQAQAN